MERRKETISALKMCRFCLTQDESMTTIYETTQKRKNAVTLPLKILSCLSIEAFPSDKMPTFICNRCSFFMDIFYDFKSICRSADERILQYIQGGSDLEAINWPLNLKKIHRNIKGSPKKSHIMKAVVEGGATVQVTSQDASYSDDDDDDEDVYNIKIGDGAKGIELIGNSKNNLESEDKSSKNTDMSCWACDECDCTYSLQQLLELHKMQKHRPRNFKCDQCDAKFFTKNDLGLHSFRHFKELQFQCVACDKKFNRLNYLKRHEKMVHTDITQLSCVHCPATFLSVEECVAHQRRHVNKSELRFNCHMCSKKFAEKAVLRRHIEAVHKEPTLRCKYCPANYSTVPKLMRHLRMHAGNRPYPCKYCDKTFVKSHHITRHVRRKHRETIRKPSSEFRCEQCSEQFGTQDELIYHSAIHATQNLICPLCQEKFQNVDEVTAHIKSHVNGMEFMCDLCELVFTSKEKLDVHLTSAHADELENESDEDESSMDVDADEFDDNGIQVKEEDGEMVVEINNSGTFMLPMIKPGADQKRDVTQSEESESEATYAELATVDTLAMVQNEGPEIEANAEKSQETPKEVASPIKPAVKVENQTASILRKAEEVKRKVQQTIAETDTKDKTINKVESSTSVSGANDKTLRLLEKELQELKRTNTRNEGAKASTRPMDNLRNRRTQMFTSTPKTRATEEKKTLALSKSLAERKAAERRVVTKENKEPKEIKDSKDSKDQKDQKEAKDTKDKEPKETKEVKETKETKEVKEAKEQKETKEVKETKETKEVKEAKGQKETKEVKETKETKESKEPESKLNISTKDVKEKEIKEKEVKEKETPKGSVKNGTSIKEETVRRSTRPSKVKDYAKMIRDKSQESSDDESDNDEEYKEPEKQDTRTRLRRGSLKAAAKSPAVVPSPVAVTPTPVRKRGRPRKDITKEIPAKQKKEELDQEAMDTTTESTTEKEDTTNVDKPKLDTTSPSEKETETSSTPQETVNTNQTEEVSKSPVVTPSAGLVVSPMGQTLKKVPIRALPPGIKPMPLPVGRSMGPGELCEMQIGKKVVKVQKIVMTKAEVEAMAKQGLVEMKDGTMVLKQGIKLPTSESLKSTLTAEKDV